MSLKETDLVRAIDPAWKKTRMRESPNSEADLANQQDNKKTAETRQKSGGAFL
jgi:hypothetical protein